MSESLEEVVEHLEDLIADGDYDKAETALDAAFEAHGQAEELLVVQIDLLLESEDFDGVVGFSQQVESKIQDDELRAHVISCRGYAQYYLDELDASRQTFNSAVRTDPELLTALVGRAMVHEHLGYYSAAVLDLDRAIDLDEQEAQPWAIRGSIHLRFGNIDAAKRDLGFAVESDKEDEESRLNLARIYALERDTPKAMELLEGLVDRGEDPDYVAPGAILRSQLSLMLNSFEAGLEDAQKAIEIIPDEPWGYLQAAACVLTGGAEPGRAIELLKEAEDRVKNLRDLPDIFPLRAKAYDQLGKADKAEEWLGKAEGTARLPAFVYGALNPAQNIPINPNKPIDIRALMDDLFGEAEAAPEGYEDVLRQIVAKIPEILQQNPNVGQIQLELPEAPGMVGGNRSLLINVGQRQSA